MRLIDADKIEVISWRAQGGREYASGFDDGVDYVVKKIDDAPTIDAIPVEWLRDKMQTQHATITNPFGFVLAEWLEQKSQD